MSSHPRSLSFLVLAVATVGCTPTSSTTFLGADAAVDTGPKPRAFFTSTTFSGDLKTAGAGTSGLDGGDRLCQAASTAAGLPGTFKAWLSDSTTNAIDRLTDVGGWYVVGTTFELFASKAALASPPGNAFSDEFGHLISDEPWTGTLSNGTRNTDDGFQQTSGNCLGWTVASMDSGATGSSSFPTGWTQENEAYQCQNLRPIYCFQQP